MGQTIDPRVERPLLGDDVLLAQQHVEMVVVVRDQLPEVVAQRIGVAHSSSRLVVGSWSMRFKIQAFSQSAGQIRPVNSGKSLVELRSR